MDALLWLERTDWSTTPSSFGQVLPLEEESELSYDVRAVVRVERPIFDLLFVFSVHNQEL